jgi:predicted transcriptional regulator
MTTKEQATAILKELEMLRKLRMVELMDRGYSQGQLAQILGVSQPTISRMVPKVALKKARHES